MKKLSTSLLEAKFITRALLSTRHPVLAHVIPMRRCNLACASTGWRVEASAREMKPASRSFSLRNVLRFIKIVVVTPREGLS